MNIRKARPKDANAIATQNILLAKETEHMILDPDTIHAGVQALLKDGTKGFYLVAEEHNTIVGQVMITEEWSDWRNKPIWWVQSVYVQKEYRQKGVFTQLLQATQQRARKQGVAFLRLYAHHTNTPALTIYEKTGWTKEPYLLYHHSLETKKR